MCIKTIKSWFKKSGARVPQLKTTSTPAEPISPRLPVNSLPHPEEPPDYSHTMANTDLNTALDAWAVKYNVPETWRAFWKTKIIITLDDTIGYPAGTFEQGGIRHLNIRPEWVNPGVIAHEQAHNSYALLTGKQKKDFSAAYTPLKTSDPYIRYLYSTNTYGLTSDIEGHAEIYRYLGERMPEILKQYYPRLF